VLADERQKTTSLAKTISKIAGYKINVKPTNSEYQKGYSVD